MSLGKKILKRTATALSIVGLGASMIAAAPAAQAGSTSVGVVYVGGGHRNHYRGGRHYYGGRNYYRGGRGYYRGGYGYRRHRGRGFGNALLGFGVGILAYDAISKSNRRSSSNAYERGYRDGARTDYDQDGYYTGQRQGNTNYQQGNTGGVVSQNSNCLQTREYQTVIVIGGEEKDAYGTACLMPDGAWTYGPPTAEPGY